MRIRLATKVIALSVVSLSACVGSVSDGPGGGDDDDVSIGPDGAPGGADGGVVANCEVDLPLAAVRPVDIMAIDRLSMVAARMPCVGDAGLRGILESPDTMWYDSKSIIPGYQDSYGDNINFPVGMRPNTIDPGLIAVAGGHDFVFQEIGVFHFPFGRPGGFGDADGFVVDFWHVPRDGGAIAPVVWWWRQPTSWHRRIEWMFPAGTVFGEVLFKVADGGEWVPFEIRTRTRGVDGWTVDAFRPFPTAESLADALERKRQESAAWQADPDIDALVAHLRDPSTLQAAQLTAPHFELSFPALDGAEDVLPGVGDPTIVHALMMETPFVSAREAVWKQSGSLFAYAATSETSSSIVPRGYNAGLIRVDDDTCNVCHRDAARPFKDYYPSIMLYGELWGEDEIFSWHPFETTSFQYEDGRVKGFGPPDNRQFRQDFEDTGLFVPYEPATHTADRYKKIHRAWRDYVYD
jgi:hypothetical protein